MDVQGTVLQVEAGDYVAANTSRILLRDTSGNVLSGGQLGGAPDGSGQLDFFTVPGDVFDVTPPVAWQDFFLLYTDGVDVWLLDEILVVGGKEKLTMKRQASGGSGGGDGIALKR